MLPRRARACWVVALACGSLGVISAFAPLLTTVPVREPADYLTHRFYERQARPVQDALHRACGVLFILVGFLQFNSSIRSRLAWVHRWLGRLFLSTALLSALGGMWMGVHHPFRRGEAVPSVVFGCLMIICGGLSYKSILAGDVEGHKRWSTRCLVIGVGVGTVRAIDIALKVLGGVDTLVFSFWAGWCITCIAGEWWLLQQQLEVSSDKAA